jgi:hypothetical protein
MHRGSSQVTLQYHQSHGLEMCGERHTFRRAEGTLTPTLLGLSAQLPPQLRDGDRQLDATADLRRLRWSIRRRLTLARIRSGTFVQAVLSSSCGNTFSAGSLRSTGVTPLPRYYGPLRLPIRPMSGYVFPPLVEHPPPTGGRPPDRASQVPWLVCRCPPSSITPESPAAAHARCFATGDRLRPSWRLATPNGLTRPNQVHLRYG